MIATILPIFEIVLIFHFEQRIPINFSTDFWKLLVELTVTQFAKINTLLCMLFLVRPVPTVPQPYPCGDAAPPPYCTGINDFPVSSTNVGGVGFAVPDLPPPFPGTTASKFLPGIHKPDDHLAHYPSGPKSQPRESLTPYLTANAPVDENMASAPPELNDDYFFLFNGKYEHFKNIRFVRRVIWNGCQLEFLVIHEQYMSIS